VSADLQVQTHVGDFVRRVHETLEAMPPIAELDDDVIAALYADTRVEIEDILATLQPIAEMFRSEIARRLRARRTEISPSTIAIPHPRLTIMAERTWTPYAFDLEKLKAAAKFVTDEERAKLIKYTPETFVPARTIAERYEPGATVSIAAIAKKYAGSSVAKLIDAGMSRQPLEDKLTIEPIRAKAPTKRAGRA